MKHTMKIMLPFLMIAGLLTACGSQESIDTTAETTQATEAVTTAAVSEKETQAVYSFFDEYDLSGKTIVPCATHAGSRLAGAPSTIEELEPNATVIGDGFSVPASDVAGAENDVTEWLGQLGL